LSGRRHPEGGGARQTPHSSYITWMAESAGIAHSVLEEISAEAARHPEMECCGLLGGRDGIITRIYPAANALGSPTAYEIAPEDLFRIMRQMRADGVKLAGIYHSHPTGDNFPSPTDIGRAFYPDVVYFIASSAPDALRPLRAFRIREGIVTELRILSPTATAHVT
jgi:proteasome lid subunit RPN8/RPN11